MSLFHICVNCQCMHMTRCMRRYISQGYNCLTHKFWTSSSHCLAKICSNTHDANRRCLEIFAPSHVNKQCGLYPRHILKNLNFDRRFLTKCIIHRLWRSLEQNTHSAVNDSHASFKQARYTRWLASNDSNFLNIDVMKTGLHDYILDYICLVQQFVWDGGCVWLVIKA